MKELMNLIIQNFVIIGLAVSLMLIFIISNMAFSIYYNTKIIKDKFSWKKLKNGIVNMPDGSIRTYHNGLVVFVEYSDKIGGKLPKEINDQVIQLIASSEQALQDFAYITSQNDVNNFNVKYGVNLIIPPAQQTS